MSKEIKIPISELLKQVLSTIKSFENAYFNEDMKQLNILLAITNVQKQRIDTIATFIEQRRRELLNLDSWHRYNEEDISSSVFDDLKKALHSDDENFTLSDEQNQYFIIEKSYSRSIASITVILRIIKDLDKMLLKENVPVASEPQEVYKVSQQANHSSQFDWTASDTDFIETFASLFEVSAFRHRNPATTRSECFQQMACLFNLNIKDLDSKLCRAKARKKNKAPFIDSLRSAFLRICLRKRTED